MDFSLADRQPQFRAHVRAFMADHVATAAQQRAGSGIRGNAICPGLIETGTAQEFCETVRATGQSELVGQLNPPKRGGEPVEIARAFAFLASDEASHVNGHALVDDGGLSGSHPFAQPRALGETTF